MMDEESAQIGAENNKISKQSKLHEVLPKSGLVYSERGSLTEILCKPKILPLKSVVLEQLEKIERAAVEQADEREDSERLNNGGIYRDK
jgi:BBSome-interacting protein 1